MCHALLSLAQGLWLHRCLLHQIALTEQPLFHCEHCSDGNVPNADFRVNRLSAYVTHQRFWRECERQRVRPLAEDTLSRWHYACDLCAPGFHGTTCDAGTEALVNLTLCFIPRELKKHFQNNSLRSDLHLTAWLGKRLLL